MTRKHPTLFLFVVALLLVVPVFAAQAETYQVRFDQISDSCASKDAGLNLAKGSVTLNRAGKKLTLMISQAADVALKGTIRRGGKFRVEGQAGQADKRSFSAAGRADGGAIEMVLVAEFYKDGKALCAQSWDVSGKQ